LTIDLYAELIFLSVDLRSFAFWALLVYDVMLVILRDSGLMYDFYLNFRAWRRRVAARVKSEVERLSVAARRNSHAQAVR
jgi:hypothetical protein